MISRILGTLFQSTISLRSVSYRGYLRVAARTDADNKTIHCLSRFKEQGEAGKQMNLEKEMRSVRVFTCST